MRERKRKYDGKRPCGRDERSNKRFDRESVREKEKVCNMRGSGISLTLIT